MTTATAKQAPVEVAATVDELLGEGLGSVVGRAFRNMEVAEEEIDGSDFPFLEARTPDNLQSRAEFLYRAHVRELVQRWDEGNKDLECPTSAELCAALAEMSLRAPLKTRFTVLYAQEVRKVCWKVGRESPIEDEWADIPALESRVEESRRSLVELLRGKRWSV